MTSRDLKRLADALKARQAELGLSQAEFAERAGTGDDALSVKTLQRVMDRKVDPRAATLGALDRAADWPPGTARALAEGEATPTAVDGRGHPGVDPATGDWGDVQRELKYFNLRLKSTEDFDRLMDLLDLYAALRGAPRRT